VRLFAVLSVAEPRYKKNLKHLHVAHPTFLMKVMTWFLQVFISPKFFNKVSAYLAHACVY
jgi:hypothetical protein